MDDALKKYIAQAVRVAAYPYTMTHPSRQALMDTVTSEIDIGAVETMAINLIAETASPSP